MTSTSTGTHKRLTAARKPAGTRVVAGRSTIKPASARKAAG
ncbi:hypothetical protein [Micromonospora kangleipakensis]|nr:hypothetical protein [Micromonospora kangleipakensis]